MCFESRPLPRRRRAGKPTMWIENSQHARILDMKAHKRVRDSYDTRSDDDIPPSWRVSRQHVDHCTFKRGIKRSNKIIYKYIGSYTQQKRIRYCLRMYRITQSSVRRVAKTSTAGPSPKRVRPSYRAPHLHPAWSRGGRPGRPAGPGLPYGDATGDDD